jgi:very-short-patch-repair endonuclease
MRQLGFDVTPQVVIPDGSLTWRVDFLVDGTRVAVEFDGLVKYDTGAALVEEKRREDRLRALGYEVVRFAWADLNRPQYVRGQVLQAIARAQRAA